MQEEEEPRLGFSCGPYLLRFWLKKSQNRTEQKKSQNRTEQNWHRSQSLELGAFKFNISPVIDGSRAPGAL